MKTIKAFAIIKDNKLSSHEIYSDTDIVLNKDEKLAIVEIKFKSYVSTKSSKKK